MELEKKLLDHYWNYDDGQSRVEAIFRDLKNIKNNPLLLHLIVENLADQNIDLEKTFYYIEVSVYEELDDKEYNKTINELFDTIDEADLFYNKWEKNYLKKRNSRYTSQRVFIKDHQTKYIKF